MDEGERVAEGRSEKTQRVKERERKGGCWQRKRRERGESSRLSRVLSCQRG